MKLLTIPGCNSTEPFRGLSREQLFEAMRTGRCVCNSIDCIRSHPLASEANKEKENR